MRNMDPHNCERKSPEVLKVLKFSRDILPDFNAVALLVHPYEHQTPNQHDKTVFLTVCF